MKFVLSPDSYKGSLTAKEVADNMEIGIKSVLPNAQVIKLPIADGGEGTVETLISANNGKMYNTTVTGPVNDPINATFGVFNNNKTAVIEVAESSGLTKVPHDKRDPWEATSYGTGEIIKYALDVGCEEIIIGLGGSATNDGGIGMAQALGVKFYDELGEEIGLGGKQLLNINKIDMTELDSRINESEIIIASDVTNVLCGKQGASVIFGPQKGATPEVVQKLDEGLYNLGQQIKKELKKDIMDIPGAGAAGGLGAGILAFLSGKMKKGIEVIFEYTDLEKEIITTDYVITGEGFTDKQTLYGKAPYGVMLLAKKYNKSIICISGGVSTEVDELYKAGMNVVISVIQSPMSLNKAMEIADKNIQHATVSLIRILMIN